MHISRKVPWYGPSVKPGLDKPEFDRRLPRGCGTYLPSQLSMTVSLLLVSRVIFKGVIVEAFLLGKDACTELVSIIKVMFGNWKGGQNNIYWISNHMYLQDS